MKPYPLRFRPVFKRTIWGGRRLAQQLAKPIGTESDYAESWEVVDHGDDQSIVENGLLSGRTLSQLITIDSPWLTGSDQSSKNFPLLLKYLDCNRVLSVQVHPDDAYAMTMPNPDLGKTEAWYIVASDPDSVIYAGLKTDVDQSGLERAVESGDLEQVLHSFHPEPGDVVFIPAGTVHALGAGLLVAEIQQSSDTTFRLFDWNRLGVDGNPRPLHLAESLAVTDYDRGPIQPRRADPTRRGWQQLVQSDKFVLRAILDGSDVLAGNDKFHIVTVPQGTATLKVDSEVIPVGTGETLLIPAAMPSCEIHTEESSVVLGMHLPD